MAQTSTSKQPMLVDRPLHEAVAIGGAAGLSTGTNFNTPLGAGCSLLVDCSSNDGASIDSVSALITEGATSSVTLLLFLSTATTAALITSTNTFLVANATIPGATIAGQRVNIPLPPLSVPVPSLAPAATTTSAYPSETDKKNTGLYVPSGKLLYAAVSTAITAPSASTRVIVAAQGGLY